MAAAERMGRRRQRRVTVAAAQIVTSSNVQRSTELILQRIAEAARLGARMVGFPEGALFGYCCQRSFWKRVSRRTFERAEQRIAELCRRRKIAAVFGTAYQLDGRWMNGLAIVDERGRLKARYAKTFLAGEKWCTNNRGALPVVELAGVKCCFVICHDIRYPELVRLPVAAGAELCWFCSCQSSLAAEHKLSAYQAMPIARATENGIFLVMCNTPADPSDLNRPGTSHGNSKIIDPDGNVMIEAGYFEQRVITATIDLSKATRRIAQRALADPTIVRPWLEQAVEQFVQVVS